MSTGQVSSNNNAFFGIKVSKPGINVTQASDTQLVLKDDYNSRIYYDDNGNPTVLLGLRAANTNNGIGTNQQGLYVSQTGIDVTQATDAQMIFNSQQDVFKIISKGTSSIPATSLTSANGGYHKLTIPHNLGFAPLVDVYVQLSIVDTSSGLVTVSYVQLPIFVSTTASGDSAFGSYFAPLVSGGASSVAILTGVDTQNIYITSYFSKSSAATDTSVAIPVTYFIRQETAAS